MHEVDHYAILGVATSATQDEIKQAFRRLARKYHPDVSIEPNAEEQFKRINEAHRVLTSAVERSNYDFSRRQRSSEQCPRAKEGSTQNAPRARRKTRSRKKSDLDGHDGYNQSDYHGLSAAWRGGAVVLLCGMVIFNLIILVPMFKSHVYTPTHPATVISGMAAPVVPPKINKTHWENVGRKLTLHEQYIVMDGLPTAPIAKPTCTISFKPTTIRRGEQSLHCYKYTGPIHRSVDNSYGILSYLGSVELDLRKKVGRGIINLQELALGTSSCGYVKPSKMGVGWVTGRYEGPYGVAECEARLIVQN